MTAASRAGCTGCAMPVRKSCPWANCISAAPRMTTASAKRSCQCTSSRAGAVSRCCCVGMAVSRRRSANGTSTWPSQEWASRTTGTMTAILPSAPLPGSATMQPLDRPMDAVCVLCQSSALLRAAAALRSLRSARIPLPPAFRPDERPDILRSGTSRRCDGFSRYDRSAGVVRIAAAYYALITHVDEQIGQVMKAAEELGLSIDAHPLHLGSW